MNNGRRARINKAIAELQSISEEIAAILDEEREAFEGMPESLQSSERGEKSQEAISNLENVDLDSVISDLENAAE